MFRFSLVLCVCLPVPALVGAQTTRVVDEDGQGSAASCDDSAAVHTSLMAAVTAAAAGDTILVCPGTYISNVDFLGKSIVVRSVGGPGVTVLDGGSVDAVVNFSSGERRSAVLEGFTIRNGWAVRGNLIVNNRACDAMGISISSGGAPLIENNTIADNIQAGSEARSGEESELSATREPSFATTSSGTNRAFSVVAGFPCSPQVRSQYGDRPVPADFDGDGRLDLAVWRASDGFWHVRTSSTEYTAQFAVQWGANTLGDQPVPADFDGDGKADIAVWRPGSGNWNVLTSRLNYTGSPLIVQWGLGALGDRPVPADFDGDGRADPAVWRATTGTWHISYSSSNYFGSITRQWGSAPHGDVPIPADFDGDGRADIAVWRPLDGVWYVLCSWDEYVSRDSAQWGSGVSHDVALRGR